MKEKMGEKAIIRQGDPTSHGGKVLEGFLDNICMGKPIAGVGHKVQCPKCKGSFPIVEGAQIALMMGRNVALEGMKTACGAPLIATQQTDTIFVGSAAASRSGNTAAHEALAIVSTATTVEATANAGQESRSVFDDRFVLVDEESGVPLANTEYALIRALGKMETGTTDAKGHTHLVSSTPEAEIIDIYV